MGAHGDSHENPYASPRSELESLPRPPANGRSAGRFSACPFCGCTDAWVPTFPWHAGFFLYLTVPRVICCNCGRAYNGRTGLSVATRNILGNVLWGALALAILVIWFLHALLSGV